MAAIMPTGTRRPKPILILPALHHPVVLTGFPPLDPPQDVPDPQQKAAAQSYYGDNPYRMDNPADATNTTLFLDHLNAHFYASPNGSDRQAYWKELASLSGTVKRFFWNGHRGFAIVSMETHAEALALFEKMGDIAWDVEIPIERYEGGLTFVPRSSRTRYVRRPFARWMRPKGTYQPLHLKPGCWPANIRIREEKQ
jgi:hypothetical protein